MTQLARAVLTLAAAGQPVPDLLLRGLADQVLSAPLVQMALQVQQGAPLARALELAEQVLLRQQAGEGVRQVG